MNTLAHNTKTFGTKGLLAFGMALAFVAIFGLTNEARAEGFLTIGGDLGGHHHDGYVTPGHYETRYQTVMVAPAHMERQWVAPQYQTVFDRFGRPSTILLSSGYWTEFYVPAQYETQAVQVWVPGYYVEDHRRGPDVGLRLGFRF
jgi:hypothetical protein